MRRRWLVLAIALSSLAVAQAAPNVDSAIACYKAGKYQQALTMFQSITPPNATTHYYSGLCYQNLKQTEKAKEEFTWVTKHPAETKIKTDAQSRLTALSGKAATAAADAAVKPTVIEFSAVWCAPCKVFAPTFEKVRTTYKEKARFLSIDIDDEKNSSLVGKYSVNAVPALVLVDKKGKVTYSHTGLLDEKTFTTEVEKLVAQ